MDLVIIGCRRGFWFLFNTGAGIVQAPIDLAAQVLRRLRRPGSAPDPYARVRVPRTPLVPRRPAAIALNEPD